MVFTSPKSRWRALVERDPDAESYFVYAVKTTNIYCRPTCAARLARRANVDFYDSAQEAEVAGYRACKRCKPQLTSQYDSRSDVVTEVCRIIAEETSCDQAEAGKPPGLKELAEQVGMSTSHLHKIFKRKVGMTPRAYAMLLRESAPPHSQDNAANSMTHRAHSLTVFDTNNHGAQLARSSACLNARLEQDLPQSETNPPDVCSPLRPDDFDPCSFGWPEDLSASDTTIGLDSSLCSSEEQSTEQRLWELDWDEMFLVS